MSPVSLPHPDAPARLRRKAYKAVHGDAFFFAMKSQKIEQESSGTVAQVKNQNKPAIMTSGSPATPYSKTATGSQTLAFIA